MTNKPDDCAICFEKLNEQYSLQCGHWLHISCVQKHFKPECPICRMPLDIQVFGTFPVNNISFEEQPVYIYEIKTQQYDEKYMSEDEDEDDEELKEWERKGYIFPEEDDCYDEENPRGDNWYYDEEE